MAWVVADDPQIIFSLDKTEVIDYTPILLFYYRMNTLTYFISDAPATNLGTFLIFRKVFPSIVVQINFVSALLRHYICDQVSSRNKWLITQCYS